MTRYFFLYFLLMGLKIGATNSAAYVLFMGHRLVNHSFVDFSRVGSASSDSVQCHTDLTTCCSGAQGSNRGDWHFPNGSRVPFTSDIMFEARNDRRVDLYRSSDNDALPPTGMYRCDIETQGGRATIYVGIYGNGGNVRLSGEVVIGPAVKIDDKLQYTLTCISTGGPVTTVIWTRDSINITDGNKTVLNDPVTARYTHTLTPTRPGYYTCNVTNDKPSNAYASLNLPGIDVPRNITTFQENETSVRVLWIIPNDVTGYIIYYSTDGETATTSLAINSGMVNTYLLTDLANGETYNISIVARGRYFLSESTKGTLVGLAPGKPCVLIDHVSTTTILISWNISNQSMVDMYEIEWERNISGYCSFEHRGNAVIRRGNTHLIEGLEEDSWYSITVIAINGAGRRNKTSSIKTIPAVPALAPGSPFVTPDTSTSISLHWIPVKCIYTNGKLTGYSVRYREVGSEAEKSEFIPGASIRYITLSELKRKTNYSFELAAVNLVGAGAYSDPVFFVTQTFGSSPTGLKVVQENATTVLVSWMPPSPTGDTTGYGISFTATNISQSVTVSVSSDHYLLTDLISGETYTITIIGLSEQNPSKPREIKITLVSLPDSPEVLVTGVTATTIKLSFSIPSGSVVTSYEIMWGENEEEPIMMSSGSLNSSSYTINQLDMSTMYLITVKATNIAGSTNSTPIIVSTVPESDCGRTIAQIGGWVGGSFLLIFLILLALLLIIVINRKSKGVLPPPHRTQCRCFIHGGEAQTSEQTYDTPTMITTSDNKAYEVAKQRKKRVSAYEMTLLCREPHPTMTAK